MTLADADFGFSVPSGELQVGWAGDAPRAEFAEDGKSHASRRTKRSALTQKAPS